MIPPWCEPYIGVPYASCDCWTLMRRVLKDRWQIDVPAWEITPDGVSIDTILAAGIDWREVRWGSERVGDVVAITKGVFVVHVGLVVSLGHMVHTLPAHNSVVEAYDGFLYRSRIAGFYRHPALA